MMYRNFDTNEIWTEEEIRETYEAEASLYEKYPDFEAYLDHLLDLGRAGEGGIVAAEAYIFIKEEPTGNVFAEEFKTKEEALDYADGIWNKMCEADKKKYTSVYVLESVNPDEDAEDHFDGDYVRAWKLGGMKNVDEAQKDLDDELETIADECEEEGYPRNGSNYSLRAEEVVKRFEEEYPFYWLEVSAC